MGQMYDMHDGVIWILVEESQSTTRDLAGSGTDMRSGNWECSTGGSLPLSVQQRYVLITIL